MNAGVYAPSTSEDRKVTVGVFMADRSIVKTCNFTNPANARNYAYMLKASENCAVSKPAMAFLNAEIKRTGAISSRAAARMKQQPQQQPKAEQPQEPVDLSELEKALTEDVEVLQLPAKKNPLSSKTIEKQYEAMKKKHPDAVLLFRVGDFYECFNDDAQEAADVLGITVCKSTNRLIAGFPHHALDTYLPKLVRAGKRVAICEQLEPKKAQ